MTGIPKSLKRRFSTKPKKVKPKKPALTRAEKEYINSNYEDYMSYMERNRGRSKKDFIDDNNEDFMDFAERNEL